jgi:predicted chitinase
MANVEFGKPRFQPPVMNDDNTSEVTAVYFAKKILTPVYENTEEEFIAKKGEDKKTTKARFIKEKQIKKEDIVAYVPEASFEKAKGGEKVNITYKKKVRDSISFKKITKAKIKEKVWVVATCNGTTGKLSVEINENKLTNTVAVYDNPVKFLIGEEEKTKIEFEIFKDIIVTPNTYAKEISLQPKSKEDVKALVDKFDKRTDKNTFLYFKAETIDPTYEIKIFEENKEFINKDNERLEVSGTPCYCGRDFTLDEIKSVVSKMRKTEGIKTKDLFTSENCPLNDSDKTYARLVEELNKTMKKHHINTCIRKIHFLAQSYNESSRYGSTLEFASGKGYNPGKHSDAKDMENTQDGDGPRYKGRGIIQLTWRKTQKAYFSYVLQKEPDLLNNQTIDDLFNRGALNKEKYIYMADKLDEKGNKIINPKTKKTIKEKKIDLIDVDSASLIANNLHFAFDSAGWFWENLGNVTANNKNVNLVADTDDVYKVSQCINGVVSRNKLYGLTEREGFTLELKKLFEYDNTCINIK